MTIIIGDLAARDVVRDTESAQLQLSGAYGVHTITIGTRTFAYVAGDFDDGISVFELGADGSLTNIQNVDDANPSGISTPLELNSVHAFASAVIGGTTYLYANSSLDDGISVFRVGADGRLTNIQNITDDAALELNGSEGKMAVTTVAGRDFLIASGDDDNGLSVFEIGSDGTLTNRFNVTDNLTLELDNALDVVTAEVGGRTFVVAAGEDDNGLAVFELVVNANGAVSLVSTDNVNDDGTLNLWGAAGLATAVIDGTTYVIASGGYDDGLSVFRLGADGRLTNTSNFDGTPAAGFKGVLGVTTFTLGGETFVVASEHDDNGLTILHLGPGGILTDVSRVFDDAGVTLDNSFYNTFVTVNGVPLLLATGRDENGVTSFEFGGGDDVLTGTAESDVLIGFRGDDTLNGGGGTDEAVFLGQMADYTWGVEGDGVFRVRSQNGANDGVDTLVSIERLRFADGIVVLNDGPGNDAPEDIRLTGGEVAENSAPGTLVGTLQAVDPDVGDTFTYALVSDPSGFFAIDGDRVVVAPGAQIDYESATSHTVTIRVTDAAGAFYDETFVLRVDDVAPLLIGTAAADTLVGDDIEGDEIRGGGGNDSISGRGGNDRLLGEAGADRLDGGAGADTLEGGLGNDTYVMSDLLDTIAELSGQGTDTVLTALSSFSLAGFANVENLTFNGTGGFSGTGNALANQIKGAAGADTLGGGGGNDVLSGGGGIDVLSGDDGNDTLTGAVGADRFVFAAGFGADRITDFDYNPTGGQDLIDLRAFGITAGTFDARVAVTDLGSDLLVTIDGDGGQTIRLTNAQAVSNVTIQDFLL